jgi:hypothetical protein
VICDRCDVNSSHARGFGSTYEKDSGLDGELLFTGSQTFKVPEIEVFWELDGLLTKSVSIVLSAKNTGAKSRERIMPKGYRNEKPRSSDYWISFYLALMNG